MSTLKLGPEGKQIFIDVYNDKTVKSTEIAKVVVEKLQEAKLITEDNKLTNALIRQIYEEKLNLKYFDRKKKEKEEKPKRVKLTLESLSFDEEELDVNTPTTEEDTTVQEEEAVEETVTDTVENDWNVNQTETRQEPVNFQS